MMKELLEVFGLVAGVLSLAAMGLLILAGIAFSIVKRDENGEL